MTLDNYTQAEGGSNDVINVIRGQVGNDFLLSSYRGNDSLCIASGSGNDFSKWHRGQRQSRWRLWR